MAKQYIDFLYEYMLTRDPKVIVELGRGDGHSTCALLRGLSKEKSSVLYSVDIRYWIQGVNNILNHKDIYDSKCTMIIVVMDDMEFIKEFNTPIDILYIDTSHFPDHTYQELTQYSKLLKNDSIILLHDTNITKANHPSGWDVMEGVNRFLSEHSEYKFTELLPEDDCGLGLLERKKED